MFIAPEDKSGLVNVVVKPDIYKQQWSLVRTEPFLIVHGELQRRGGMVNLVARGFRPLRARNIAPDAHNFG